MIRIAKHIIAAFQTGAKVSDKANAEYNLNNPYDAINPMLQGLSRRGVDQVFHYNTSALEMQDEKLSATGYWLDLTKLSADQKFQFNYTSSRENISNFEVLFVRGDDVNETTLEQIAMMDNLQGPKVVNPGSATLSTRDKFAIPQRASAYPGLIPQTHCVRTPEDLEYAWKDIQGDTVVLKGRYGSSGDSVEKFPKTPQGYAAAKKHFSKFGDLVAQEFMPEINEGDVRFNVVDGKVIRAFRRISGKSWITNVSNGGTAHPLKISPQLRERAELAASLFPEVYFQGVDLTYTTCKLIETNAFPASIGSMSAVYGINHEEEILGKILGETQ